MVSSHRSWSSPRPQPSQTDEHSPDVSVILPVFNERSHVLSEIQRVRKGLEASPHSYEIIVVDDASTDGSTSILREEDGIRLLCLQQNRGSGNARRLGTRAAKGEVIVWTDVDMTYPNDRIPELVDALEGVDQVVGARRSEEGEIKFLRVPAKWMLRRLASYLTRTDIPDLNSGFRAFRRSVGEQFLHLLPDGFSCVTTITLSFISEGYSIRYVPIDYAPRVGESKFHWWSDTKKYLTQIIRMILSFEPLRVFMPLGTTLLFISILKLILDWSTRNFALAENTVLMFLISFNIIAIGLLADLLVTLNRKPTTVDTASIEWVGDSIPEDESQARAVQQENSSKIDPS